MKYNDIKKEFAVNPRLKEWHEDLFFKGFATPKQMKKLLEEGIIESTQEYSWRIKSGWQWRTFYRAKEGE